MKVFIYIADFSWGNTDGHHLDIAIEEINAGNEVFILNCDNSIGLCMRNPYGNNLKCKLCAFCQKTSLKKYLLPNIEQHWMHEYVSRCDINSLPKLEYKNSNDLKKLTYKGIEIGYGVLSTYISLTRNLNPKINADSRKYFDALIQEQLITLNVIEELQAQYHFDKYIFQNGRGAQFKPILNFCEKNNIEFICTEYIVKKEQFFLNDYKNTIPHNIHAVCKRMEKMYCEVLAKRGELCQKEAISFFENRRNAKPAGDKVYTKNQQIGLMPQEWNNSVENIVIFNSSEDEFAAISKEFDEEALFRNQIEGIIAIVEHYRNDKTKHFTLRVHPNLNGIPYKYHTDLYKFKYKNLTVIPSNSPISTYTLMDAADKIIVFGSTTGAEAAYWGKPVICLAAAFYKDLKVTYKPDSIDKLWNLIDSKKLPPLEGKKALPFGFYFMSSDFPKTKYIDCDIYEKKIFGKKASCYNYQKILNSNFLYCLIWKIINNINLFSKFKKIPIQEE